MNNPKFPPYLALTIAVIAVSFSAIFIRFCIAPPLIIAFYRLFFSSLCLLPFAAVQNKKLFPPVTKNEFGYCFLSGLFLALHFSFWITSLQMTTIASATILCATQPLFGSFLGWLILREPLSRLDIFSLLISFAGMMIIGHGDFHLGNKEILGDVFATVSGALAAAYFLVGRNIRKSVNLTNYITLAYSSSSVCLAIFALLLRNSFTPYSSHTFFWFIMLALVPTIIGHSLFNWSLKYVSTHKVGMTIFAEPLGAIILAFFIFAEIPPLTMYIGGILILIGLYLALVHPKPDPESSEILA